MNREEARKYIRENWRDLLLDITEEARDKVNGEASYICPLCDHGTHGDGLTFNPKSSDENGLHCFSCNFSGDILDLMQRVYGISFTDALNLAAEKMGVTIDGSTDFSTFKEKDFTDYYKRCQASLTSPIAISYLKKRGISVDTARMYGIGYDSIADPAESGYNTPRLIIPVNEKHYIGRSVDDTTPKQFQKINNCGAEIGIFNLQALYDENNDTVFVVEGVFDALSILEMRSAAIALNSISNADKLIRILEQKATHATLILALDNDSDPSVRENVRNAEQAIINGLTRLNVSYATSNISGEWKDPNEHLMNNRDSFLQAIKDSIKRIKKPDNVATYLNEMLRDEIERFKQSANIKTGYYNLDKSAGGLYPGLYAIAAISSLGKTTFMHQMADQIAASGHDVIYFSMEQSRLELVSKSLARITARKDMDNAVTSLAIRKGNFSSLVADAVEQYKNEVSDHLSIIESNFNCDCDYIDDYIRRYINRTGSRPVVIIDYLQVLQPETSNSVKKQSVKEMIDSTVVTLRRMSRELDLTVIIISSVNRANYMRPIDFESLKESGGIEYTCDVVYGLQLQCLEREMIFGKKDNIKEQREFIRREKAKNPREIELVCLKNRYGISSFNCYFDYYPAYDLFVPSEPKTPFDEDKPKKRNKF